MTWRLLEEDRVGADRGLAVDETLARRAGCGICHPTLRLYTYRPHVALVGRFQDVQNEIHEAYCQHAGIEINRRPTGGGAIIMGPDQLGVALALPGRSHGRPRDMMSRFSLGLVRGLELLGIQARFRGKNDLEVQGKKIAGLGIYRDVSGGLLFHASLLVNLDVSLMSKVLKAPAAATRTSTVRELLGEDITLAVVRRSVAAGFRQAFTVDLIESTPHPDEHAAADALVAEKYGTRTWVHQRTEVRDSTGVAGIETGNGRIEARVALAGRMVKSLAIRGDFFESDRALADLEARLCWHSSEQASLRKAVLGWALYHSESALDPDVLVRVITDAVARAHILEADPPYACFANPGGEHD